MIQLSPQRRPMAKIAALITSAAIVLTACGTSSDTASGSSDSPDSDAYPMTVETVYGDITIKEKPEKVVALLHANAEFLAALDVPVAAIGNASGYSQNDIVKDRPWIPDEFVPLLDTDMLLPNGEAVPEVVAKYEPDLIVGGKFAITTKNFDQLSSIAPAYGGVSEEGDSPWQETLKAYGKMTGKDDEAKSIVADIESSFEDIRTDLPGIQGKTYATAWVLDGQIQVGPEKSGWPEEFGLKSYYDDYEMVSPENYDTIDADVVFLKTFGNEEIENDPRIQELPASKNGTLIIIGGDGPMSSATDNPTPLSLPWLRDNLGALLKDSELNKSA